MNLMKRRRTSTEPTAAERLDLSASTLEKRNSSPLRVRTSLRAGPSGGSGGSSGGGGGSSGGESTVETKG